MWLQLSETSSDFSLRDNVQVGRIVSLCLPNNNIMGGLECASAQVCAEVCVCACVCMWRAEVKTHTHRNLGLVLAEHFAY